MPNSECAWDPAKHGGKPCPKHGGGLWDENILTRNEKLKKSGYSKEDLEDEDLKEDFDPESSSVTRNEINEETRYREENLSEEQHKYIEELNNQLPEELLPIFAKMAVESYKIMVDSKNSDYTRGMRRVRVSPRFLEGDEDHWNQNLYFKGQVYYHELGHAVDNILCEGNYQFIYASSTYRSKKTDKTLHETIKLERRSFDEIKIANIRFDVKNEYIDKAREALGDLFDAYVEARRAAMLESSNGARLTEEIEKYFKEHYPDKDFEKAKKGFKEYYSRGTASFMHDYCILSDIASSKWFETDDYGSKNKGFGLGHSESYYQSRPFDGLGSEFFANAFTCICRGNKKAIEVTRKYFPKSVEVFEEIIEEMKK